MILRHSSLIDQFDVHPLVLSQQFYSSFQLKKFFEFERQPKLRGCEFNRTNVQELFFNRHFMLVYIQSETPNQEHNREFEKAIQHLPKRMIYSRCQMDNTDINQYLHLFMMAQSTFQPEGVYILHVSPAQQVESTPFTKEFTQENLKNFVFENYQRYKFFFDDQNEAEDREKFEAEEL